MVCAGFHVIRLDVALLCARISRKMREFHATYFRLSATLIERGLTRGRSVFRTVEMKIPSPVVLGAAFASFLRIADVCQSAPVLLNTNLQIRLVMNTTNGSAQNSVRIAKDPRNNQLYYLKINGDIFRVNLQPPGGVSTSTKVYGATDHGLSSNVEGFAIGPDGTIYVLGNNTP